MFPAKILGAFGDAGAVITNNDDLARHIRLQRNHGRVSKYDSIVEGGNARLDALQAKILSVKLDHLDKWIEARRRLAQRYTAKLKGVVGTPVEREWAMHPYYMYVIRSKKRDALMKHLSESGIECGIHYPKPLHLQQAYAFMEMDEGSLPATEQACAEILSIPLYPEMTDEEQNFVIEAILEIH
jgi:dTDP-4-amino-4,6-dideoxygalactose transaminase